MIMTIVNFIKNPENVKLIVLTYIGFTIMLCIVYGTVKEGKKFFKSFF